METFGESAEGFVNLAFWKAFKQADQFVLPDGTDGDGTKEVTAWLFRILHNVYLDNLRSEDRRPVDRNVDGQADWLNEVADMREEAVGEVPSGNKSAMLAFLETLPPKDREILTVTAEFWDPRTGEVVIDDDVRAGLCVEFGLTEASLRVRRKRLRERAKDFIQEYKKTNNHKQSTHGTYEDPQS
jgi:hypothetical protein